GRQHEAEPENAVPGRHPRPHGRARHRLQRGRGRGGRGPAGGRRGPDRRGPTLMPSPKITYVGAGSAEFAARLITDVVATPGLDSGTFALVDIDAERLELSRRIAEKVVAASGKAWQVVAFTERE